MSSAPTIELLPPLVANRIAAGEVVERPASVVKELVENSIDAGATSVVIEVEAAGRRLIAVDDDGDGMHPIDAERALLRHATSKIRRAEDLQQIASHGFRGEALPSIASVGRLRLHTCPRGGGEGSEVRVDDQGNSHLRPAAARRGTRVEVRDLFRNTPARLRFLRSKRTEEAAIVEHVRALALAHPSLAITLRLDGRTRIEYRSEEEDRRVASVLGDDFARNSHHQSHTHRGVRIDAWLGLPTLHHRDGSRIWLLVNGRAIRDRMLLAALRAAYRDVLFHDRYPIAVIQIHIDPALVDVNVHPAKREVRFSDPATVRAALIGCVHAALERMGRRGSDTTAQAALAAMRPSAAPVSEHPAPHHTTPRPQQRPGSSGGLGRLLFSPPSTASPAPVDEVREVPAASPGNAPCADGEADLGGEEECDFGLPLAQIHRRYLLTQVTDGILLIDQHAAHERIRYERFKAQMRQASVTSQQLLTPVRWQPQPELAAWLHDHPDALAPFGIGLRAVDDVCFVIDRIPSLLGHLPPEELAEEVASALRLGNEEDRLGAALERLLADRACKRAITSGQMLDHEAQRALLQEMARCPNIAQCNHGRPTWIKLTLDDLDRLFGRKG
ncbi:MAG: DNA mismatch repair endonuclease MutL [Zetaproteobacteria bacterium]|nr:MAG: DNA mismatch repair endonuclease MutL [Zetaproteobacteria bacterium]